MLFIVIQSPISHAIYNTDRRYRVPEFSGRSRSLSRVIKRFPFGFPMLTQRMPNLFLQQWGAGGHFCPSSGMYLNGGRRFVSNWKKTNSRLSFPSKSNTPYKYSLISSPMCNTDGNSHRHGAFHNAHASTAPYSIRSKTLRQLQYLGADLLRP